MIFRALRHTGLLLSLFLVSPGVLNAQETIQTEHGNVFVMTFREYADRSDGPTCHKLPRVIGYKAFQSQDNENFTPEEYRLFAGDSPYLGLRGHDFWYARDKRKYVSWDELFPEYGAMGSGNWDELPVLCGAANQPKPAATRTAPPAPPPANYREFNDYVLDKSAGHVALSYFDRPGDAWCRHVYVTVIAEYATPEARQALLEANPASYLQDTIVPRIREICPEFPNAAKYFRQTIVLKFRPAVGRIADESLNTDKLGFELDDNGHVSLIKDLAYRNWKDPGKGTYAFEAERRPAAATESNEVLAQGTETLMEAVQISIADNEDALQQALKRRDDYQAAFANTAVVKFFEALTVNEDAVSSFQNAIAQNQQALEALTEAQRLYRDPAATNASLTAANQRIEAYQQYRQQALALHDTGWDKLIEGNELFKAGFAEFQKRQGEN